MLPWFRKRRADCFAVALLALIVIAFFYPLWGQGAWLPYGGGDAVSFLYPMYRFIAASFHSGEIPLWNPHQYSGYPLIADNQAGMFYPFNLVLFLLHPNFGYQWIQVLVAWHLFWAGLGTYICARLTPSPRMSDKLLPPLLVGEGWGKGLSSAASLLAAVAFMFSDVFITHLGNLNLIAVAAWLPWAFLTFRAALNAWIVIPSEVEESLSPESKDSSLRLAQGRQSQTPRNDNLTLISALQSRLPWVIVCGLTIGISTLAGHGQMTFFIAFFLGVYALWRTIVDRSWRPFAALAIVGAIGFGLSALTLLPTYEMNELTRRGAFSYEQTVNYSLPWQGLVGIVAPGFYGRGAANFWGSWDRVEYGYAGVVTLILAGYGVFGRRKLSVVNGQLPIANETPQSSIRNTQCAIFSSSRITHHASRDTLFFTLATVLFLLLALGGNTPVHRWLLGWAQLPFQVPARFVLLMNFCMALLAGFGVEKLGRWGDKKIRLRPELVEGRQEKGKPLNWLISLLGVVGIALGLFFLRSRYDTNQSQMLWAIALFTVFAIAAIFLSTQHASRITSLRNTHRPAQGAAQYAILILLTLELFITSQYVEIERNNPVAGYQNDVATAFLQANTGINRIDEATGLWQASGAQIAGLYSAGGVFNPLELARHAVFMGSVGYRGSPTYSLMGIKYIVADKSEPPGDTAFLVSVSSDDPDVDIYLNTNALPRLMLLYNSVVVADGDEAFETLFSGIDFTKTIIVEGGVQLDGAVAVHEIGLIEYGLNRVVVDVITEGRGYLLLTDMWYPHWVAEVDNVSAESTTTQQAEIIPANYAFRAILLEPGQHRVEMRFQPQSWRIGLTISSITWLVVGGALPFLVRRRFEAKERSG